ncbi:MAG: biosynthetic arginine decarboxylase [Verrucomicrobiia bacterium]
MKTVNEAFRRAIAELGYRNAYKGVFPIKVNQLREVVEEIVEAGLEFHFGLEAGSKPELIAALAVHRDPESLIVCNGYKDAAFIRNALLGRRLGKQVILVVEKIEELSQILHISREMNVEPMIGVRVRLQSKSSGKWALSGGENAKFGLSTTELMQACEMLSDAGLPQAFKMVHFHVGSQVPDIVTIKRASREAARYYAKLCQMGFEMGFIDVGGGLGVDYDGSRTNWESSTNYSLDEYARDIVYNIMDICDAEKVPHPVIVSESGRAIVAHHSVLVIEAFSSIAKISEQSLPSPSEEDHKLTRDILEIASSISEERRLENFHDAQQIKEQAQSMFELGLLDIAQKARIESAFWHIAARTVELFRTSRYVPEEVREIETSIADQFVCNFSVFQSLLDHWALGQLFPVMPVHRLNEAPDRKATLVDITCDSDGKVSKFIDLTDVRDSLPLHALKPGEPYYLGVFLVGAYQDIMGDLHNLFGRVNEVHVFLDEDEEGGYYIEEVIEGSTIAQVLSFTQWEENELVRRMKQQVDAAIKSDRLKPNDAMRLLADYERGLKQYTYLEFGNGR